jgi:hypothetical protein
MADRKAVFNGVKLMIEKQQKRISHTSTTCWSYPSEMRCAMVKSATPLLNTLRCH